MGFLFNKKKNNTPTKEQKYMQMASEIIDKLGYKKGTFNAFLSFSGGYDYDYVYEGFGLELVKPERPSEYNPPIYINFNKERVLDKDTYVPGLWEEVLNELYNKINVILQQREDEKQLLRKQESILRTLMDINNVVCTGDIVIDDSLRIDSYDNISGYYDEHYNGTNFTVYLDNKEVFRAYYASMGDNKFYHYEPGLWETKLDLYLNKVLLRKEMEKEQQNNNFARESIMKLRNL